MNIFSAFFAFSTTISLENVTLFENDSIFWKFVVNFKS